MNHELLKELKDAGLPQNGSFGRADMVFAPTLSELIEACECEGFSLFVKGNEIPWHAEESSGTFAGGGQDPETAVARLWLALNKK